MNEQSSSTEEPRRSSNLASDATAPPPSAAPGTSVAEAATGASPRTPRPEEQTLPPVPTIAFTADSQATDLAGQTPGLLPTIPGYELLSELGRGGMGVVYKARQTQLQRLVALKMILAGGHAGAAERARFRTEAEAIARLQHPNIVQVHEIGEHEGKAYFSLEFCGGGSLAEHIKGTPLPPLEAARIVEILARTMEYAHKRGVIHRDLKPANVLLETSESTLPRDPRFPGATLRSAILKITDFGLAKKVDEAGQTASGAVMGTPSYMAPEQAASRGEPVGRAADVYALGAILYELVTGRPPFKAVSAMDTLLQVVGEDPLPPRQLQSKTPKDLETICLKCLQKEPHKRYSAAEDLAEDLRRFQAREPIQARPVGRMERSVKWVRRRPVVAALLAAVILLVIAGTSVSTYFAVEAGNRAEEAENNLEVVKEKTKLAEANAVEAARQKTIADEKARLAEQARRRTRQALDRMSSTVIDEWLGKQTKLSDEQKKFLEQALEDYEQFTGEAGDTPEQRLLLARAHGRIGNIRKGLGLLAEAGDAYERSVQLLEPLHRAHPTVPDYAHDLANTYSDRGQLLGTLGRSGEAQKSYDAALTIQETLVRNYPDVPVYANDLARTHNHIGGLCLNLGQHERALQALDAALKIQQDLLQGNPEDLGRAQAVAGTLNNRGLVLKGLGKVTEAIESYDEAIRIRQRVVREYRAVPDFAQELKQTHHNRAALLDYLGRREEALEGFDAARKLAENLVREYPAVPAYAQSLARTQNSRGIVLRDLGQNDKALEAHDAALKIRETLVRNYPEVPEYAGELARTHNTIGILQYGLGKRQEALKAYGASLKIQETLARDYPEVTDYALDLGGSYVNLGHLVRDGGKPEEALGHYDKALAILQPIYQQETRSPMARRFLRNVRWGRAEAFERLGRHFEALANWDQAVQFDEPKAQEVRARRLQCLHKASIELTENVKRDPGKAIQDAELLAKAEERDGVTLYNCACVLSLASAVQKEAPRKEQLAERAVQLLRQAERAQFFQDPKQRQHMQEDSDLAPLRQREDYRKLLADLCQ